MENAINYEYHESPFGTSVEIVEIVASGDGEEQAGAGSVTKLGPKDRFIAALDKLQNNVEFLRYQAQKLEDERDSVLANLDLLRNTKVFQTLTEGDKEEVETYMNNINFRCQTVNIRVHTPRNGPQEDCLHKVNTLIDGMISTLREDPVGMHGRCLAFIRSGTSKDQDEMLYAMIKGLQPLHIDRGFEDALLGCTLDDQKLVKRRLNGLLDYILNFPAF